MPKYKTPDGRKLTLKEVVQQERVICHCCKQAVTNDEYVFCDICLMAFCRYCWERNNYWDCPNCGVIHSSLREYATSDDLE